MDVGILEPMSFLIASSLKSTKPDRKIRIDLEPCWEEDPRQVVFRAHVDRVPIYTFSALRLIDRMHGRGIIQVVHGNKENRIQVVSCDCGGFSDEISIPESQR